MSQVNLLAIDTSMEACSAALLCNGITLTEYEVCPQQHSQKILPMVQALLKQANCELSDIDYLVFGKGPGSFTGVRIACGIIQGLTFGANIKAIGVSTLAAMAYATGAQKVAVASDARMGEVYYGEYVCADKHTCASTEDQVITPELAAAKAQAFSPNAIAGTGWGAYPELMQAFSDYSVSTLYPKAESMLAIALQQLEQNTHIALDAANLEPVYLRDKVTWKKLPGRE